MSGDTQAFHSLRDMLRVSLAHRIDGQLAGAGHRRKVPSSPPEARRVPSGLKATLQSKPL